MDAREEHGYTRAIAWTGAGRFLRATLRPRITISPGADLTRADAIHREIDDFCFIARSVNFPVHCEARYETAS